MDDARVTTALALLTDLGLPADEAAVLHASNTLTLRVLPADVVARIAPRDRAGDLAVELERAEALQAVGAPVGPPDPRLAPTVHVCDVPARAYPARVWSGGSRRRPEGSSDDCRPAASHPARRPRRDPAEIGSASGTETSSTR